MTASTTRKRSTAKPSGPSKTQTSMEETKKYDVEIEELDDEGNVWDSHEVLSTDDYDEACRVAQEQELEGPYQQVSIWEWDDNHMTVVDSNVVKTFDE